MTQETIEKNQIRDYLRYTGWFVFHNLAGLGVYAGIADLTAIKNGCVLMIEVKTEKGKLSEKQILFEEDWQEKGGHYIWGHYERIKNIIECSTYGKA